MLWILDALGRIKQCLCNNVSLHEVCLDIHNLCILPLLLFSQCQVFQTSFFQHMPQKYPSLWDIGGLVVDTPYHQAPTGVYELKCRSWKAISVGILESESSIISYAPSRKVSIFPKFPWRLHTGNVKSTGIEMSSSA